MHISSILFGMEPRSREKKRNRLNQQEWLAASLEVLSREGKAKLRIEKLANKIGVTKGSFYWHFRNRKEFVKRLAEYWAWWSTEPVIEAVENVSGDASKRLLVLMEGLAVKDYGKYDLAMRAWAAQEPQVARIVREVDKRRLSFVRSLFLEMGFRGKELEMRARTFLCFHSLELGIFYRGTKKERLELVKVRHAFFTNV